MLKQLPLRSSASLATAFLVAAWLAVPLAEQAPANAPAQKPIVPVAASSLAANPEAFYGDYVSLIGTVDELLSKSAFSVDQDKSKHAEQAVLIVAPTLNGTVDANTYVTVLGEVMKFDPAQIVQKARNYALDLSAGAQAKFQGRPVVLATAVINASGIDVARRLPPPIDRGRRSVRQSDEADRPLVHRVPSGHPGAEPGHHQGTDRGPEAGLRRSGDLLEETWHRRRAAVDSGGAQARGSDRPRGRRGKVGRGQDCSNRARTNLSELPRRPSRAVRRRIVPDEVRGEIDMRRFSVLLLATLLAVSSLHAARIHQGRRDGNLPAFFAEWRAFQQPKLVNGVPDYGQAAMSAQRTGLAAFQRRLAAMDKPAGRSRSKWTGTSSAPR